jgi:hypothetical protein
LWWRPWRRLLSKVAMFKDLAYDFVFLYERDDLHRAAAWFAKLLTTGLGHFSGSTSKTVFIKDAHGSAGSPQV